LNPAVYADARRDERNYSELWFVGFAVAFSVDLAARLMKVK